LTFVALFAAGLAAQAPPHSFKWTPQKSGVTVRLRGVSAVSATVAWASGAAGTVIRTEDAGQTWQKLTVPDAANLDFRDVDGIDANTAYVLSIGAGPLSRIYKTTDAGKTWRLQFTNNDPKAFYDAMAFWDATNGLAVSDSVDGKFVILRTTDGSKWTRVPPDKLPPALPNEGAFAGSGTNVTVMPGGRAWFGTGAAERARVLRTFDGGVTWTVSDTPIAASASSGIFSVAFRDARNGIAVGGDYQRETDATANAAKTADTGLKWTPLKGLGGFRSAVAHVPGTTRTWVAVGPSGADVSGDDGRNWAPIEGEGYDAFSMARRGRAGWGVGSNGRIAKLTW
jgi:photosystem II stability/assembly factor-like uncharacterized protein